MSHCHCDWCYSRIERRDFRADHGSGPESLPHRKKAKKVDKAHCDHQWSDWYEKSSRYGGHDKAGETWRWTIFTYKHRVCRVCHKRERTSQYTIRYYTLDAEGHPVAITETEYRKLNRAKTS